jgi:acetyl-CoA carboxylase biotin carboxyl carrier protein
MRPEEIAAIAAEMAIADIARLELTGPGFTLALARGGTRAGDVPEAPAPDADLVPVIAPAIGSFLRSHPLHEKPLAADGEAVVAGQPIALLRVGALLVPVPAPADGMIVAALPEEGALVGYGDRLFDFLPND